MSFKTPKVHNPELREVVKQQTCTLLNWAVPAADDDYFKTSTALAAQTTTLLAASMTKSCAIDVPVVPVLVVTNDKAGGEVSWTSVSATFVGINKFGDRIGETVAGVNVGDVWTATANNAYATLVSVAFTVAGGTACDGSDSYIIGFAKTFGLGVNIRASGDVLIHNLNLATDAGTVDAQYNTYKFAGTPNGTLIGSLWVRSSAY